MKGPTMVPCRVMTASTARAVLRIRFMILLSRLARLIACLVQSDSSATKKVVLPESP